MSPDAPSLPRAIWTTLPNGKQAQIWVDTEGKPLPVVEPEPMISAVPVTTARIRRLTLEEAAMAVLLRRR